MSNTQFMYAPTVRQRSIQTPRLQCGFAASTFSLLAGLLQAACTDFLALLRPVWKLLEDLAFEIDVRWERLLASVRKMLGLPD